MYFPGDGVVYKPRGNLHVPVNTWKRRKYDDESGLSRGGLRGDCVTAPMMLSVTAAWGRSQVWTSQAAKSQQKPSADTHLLHMSILPLNPWKGFPESSSPSSGPQLFEVLILCVFMALKSLSYGHVMSSVWSKYLKFYMECLMYTIGHKPAY